MASADIRHHNKRLCNLCDISHKAYCEPCKEKRIMFANQSPPNRWHVSCAELSALLIHPHKYCVDTSVILTILNVLTINLSHSTNENCPLICRQPYNQDKFLILKGVHVMGSHCAYRLCDAKYGHNTSCMPRLAAVGNLNITLC